MRNLSNARRTPDNSCYHRGVPWVRPIKPDRRNIMRAVVITAWRPIGLAGCGSRTRRHRARASCGRRPPSAGEDFSGHLARVGLCQTRRNFRRWSDTEVAGTVERLSVMRSTRAGRRTSPGRYTIGGYCEIVNIATTDSVVLPDALSFEQRVPRSSELRDRLGGAARLRIVARR